VYGAAVTGSHRKEYQQDDVVYFMTENESETDAAALRSAV